MALPALPVLGQNPWYDTRTNWDNAVAALLEAIQEEFAAHVTPEMFGAVGNETADDTAAFQAMFDHLATNGGVGTSAKSYRITTSLNIIDAAKPAQFYGLRTTRLIADFTTSVNGINGRNLDKWKFADFSFTSIGAARLAHGIAMANCRDSEVDSVSVTDYYLSAAMFYKNASFTGESLRNRISNCNAHANNIGRNGFFHESSTGSVISTCHVFNLSSTEGPGYGLQLKNNSVDCHIVGGSVNGAEVGVAFGYELADSWANGCTVTGVSVKNCTHGFLGSRMNNCTIDLFVDMAGAKPLTAIRLAGNAIKNYVSARIATIGTGQTAVYCQDSDNVVDIPLINGFSSATLLELGASADNNYITYGRIVGTSVASIPTLPLPTLGSNIVVYESETPWTTVPLVNAWTVALGRTVQVKRINNTVYIRGQVEAGTAGVIGTIPGGFRPSGQTIVINPVLSTASVTISTGGTITVSAAGIGGSIVLNHPWPIF